MLHLVSDIGGSDVIVEAFGVILDHDFALALALILPLYELLLNVVVSERLHKRAELLLLVVPGGPSRVDEDGGRDDCSEYFGLLEFSLVDVEDDEEVEIDALVVIGGGGKLDGTEVDLSVDHLHLALPPDAYVDQRHPVRLLVFGVFLYSEDLGLCVGVGTYRLRGESRKSPVV
jgi:hypothetical protein